MQLTFAQRPPSGQWEPLPVQRVPGLMLWAWFRPPHLPGGLLLQIPPEVHMTYPAGFPFTLADLLMAAGIELSAVHSVSCYGGPWQGVAGMGAFLSHALPPIPPGAVPEIAVQVLVQTAAAPAVAPSPTEPVQDTSGNAAAEKPAESKGEQGDRQKMMYERIENAWRSSVQMERQMAGLRQKLASILNSLSKLDRDLHPDERLAADREDRDAWHDTRRWLRDLGAKCHREIKSFDVGMTSAAGRRNAIEQIYQQIIEPRAPASDLAGISREFESYRKDMVNLQRTMQTALQAASQNGTQRAGRVLGVIGRKIRERRARMREPLGGTNLDKSVRRKS